jgi:hypothetical protein
MTTATLPRLIGGGTAEKPLNNRIKCVSCGRMVPMYVDRGDGTPLRWSNWASGVEMKPDPTLSVGGCVMAYDVLPACPFCGLESAPNQRWGRSSEVKGTWSPGPCGPDCHEATGSKCKCSCRGANHGIL